MKKSAKIPFILLAIATTAAIVCFAMSRKNPSLLWAGTGATALALIFLMVTLTRFLRNRSIVSGLFISTTVITVIYFVGTRFINTAVPLAFAGVGVANAETGTAATNGFFTPVFLAQIGLFILWFLLILFIIYVYVRPIKKIDYLLSQIIAAKEIKKLRLGSAAQYQKIAEKLQVLADEKHRQELKRQNRLAKARARADVKKSVVEKILKEKDKIPKPGVAE